MKYLTLLLLATVLVGCSPQKRLNRKIARAERFAKKHGLTIMDTVRITDIDTFIVENVTHDTTTYIVTHDTHTVINNERVKLIYRYDTITNEIWHHVECKGDTIIKPEYHTITTEKIKHVPTPIPWWVKWVVIGFCALLLFQIVKRVFLKN